MIKINNYLIAACIIAFASCKIPSLAPAPVAKQAPNMFPNSSNDSTNSAAISYKSFFADTNLRNLIDTALHNNQELAIAFQEIQIAKNEIKSKHGKILPMVEAGIGLGVDKVGRFTSQGAGDASTEIDNGKLVPEWLPDFRGGLKATWEVDIWKKLRNAKKAAAIRYMSSIEGRNFLITNLVAEIANSYFELLALDNQLDVIRKTIVLQKKALEVVKVQKQAAAATELAVKKFEGEVYSSQSLEYDVLQRIQEKENLLNLMLGRYPQPIVRDTTGILSFALPTIAKGIPSQLLANRPDVKQAAFDVQAAKLDVAVTKAEFLPSFNISGALGAQAFSPSYLAKLPESMLFNLTKDLAAPIFNRHAIIAEYKTANAKQIQALYGFERSVLTGFIEVNKEVNNLQNLIGKYDNKKNEVDALLKTIDIANDLFKSNRADYLEVLLTQRDALKSRIELIETKLQQCNAITNMYRALGGGWK